MPHAIIRVAKIKTAGAARGKTAHNYRLVDTPNADQVRTGTLNQEYINTDKVDYWSLAEKRIAEVVTRKVRDDQVRAMEVVLTASPEYFKRGQDGQAEDVRGGKWVESNLNFLKERFGGKNIVSFTLHQDETTPHIHAVVIPITQNEKGRVCLSADRLFNPKTLHQLQTDYGTTMATHGLERGVEGSRRQHQDMKQMYGQQAQTAEALAEIPGGATFAEVVNVAVANSGARKRVKVLEQQLRTAEALKQANYVQLQSKETELIRLAVGTTQKDLAAVQVLLDYGNKAREEAKRALIEHLEHILKGKIFDQEQFITQLRAAGYKGQRTEQGTELVHELTGARFPAKEIQPNGQSINSQLTAAIERTNKQTQEPAEKLAPKRGPRLS